MNYLAHAFLSPDNRELVLLGNLACDMLRPSDAVGLDPEIREGMVRHQAIDRTTDRHNGFRSVRDALASAGHPYAGVLTDILFDYYLATSWKDFCEEELSGFSGRVYGVLNRRSSLIPGSFMRMTKAMRMQDWFGSYASEKGLQQALHRLNYRSSRYIDPEAVMITERSIREEALPAFYTLMDKLTELYGPRIPSIDA
jgi:acyl carrier protein phosphodiesterase